MNIDKLERSRIDECDFNDLHFGKVFTDYMLVSDYDGETWSDFTLGPLKPLELHPGASSLHYGQTIFEGLKAFKSDSGRVNIFRLRNNLERINVSAERMAMPTIDIKSNFNAILKFVELQKQWVPKKNQGSLYVRPFMIATDDALKAIPSKTYKYIVIACPVGFYYDRPLNIKIEQKYRRAATGGVGYAKAGGNYGASFFPTIEAQKDGFDQLIWTDINNNYSLEELGSANFFFMRGELLVTPMIKDSILKGITRDTVIQLAKEKGIEVSEEVVELSSFESDLKSGNVTCMFATGTAAAVTYVDAVTIGDIKYEVNSELNEKVASLKKEIHQIKYLEKEDNHGWNVIV